MSEISKIYNKFLSDGDDDYARVGWGSSNSQKERFRVLTEVGSISSCSVLDVGCGLGGLYDYLSHDYSNFTYIGIDINENMILEAMKRHPAVEFMCDDILAESSLLDGRTFDYVFLSGALNLSLDNQESTIFEMMEAMYRLAVKGAAINFLSIHSDFFSPGEYYCNPEKILKMAFSITKKVNLRHDYMPHDFTVYLYK